MQQIFLQGKELKREGKKVSDKMADEKYNGWTNRETWTVKLHWDNNEGDYRFFTDEAKRFKKEGKSAFEFAEFLEEQAEEIQEQVINNPEQATQEAKMFIQDTGSLWRVDWREIAEAYFQDIEEIEKYERQKKKPIEVKKKKGWRMESARHSLARKGVKTGRRKRK